MRRNYDCIPAKQWLGGLCLLAVAMVILHVRTVIVAEK